MQTHYTLFCKQLYRHTFSRMEKRGKPNWDWTPVECTLKTTESNRRSVVWQLAQSIVLTNPSSNYYDPTVKLYIDIQKSLQYSTELGWNWHKSWNLPNISIRLQIKDEISNDQLLSPKNLYAQIFAVKKSPESADKQQKMSLIDVGIRGQSKMQMIDGQVYFSAMKFSSTTYNNEGINFNLLIVLYINEIENDKPKVLTAVLSPPIFVDSRRSARDYQQKKFNSFIEPFTLDQLDKQFIKRQNKSRSDSQIFIKNDSEGFYNYLTAPNIRHKVKHPVFLAIKFQKCVKIYYNTTTSPCQSLNEILETLQKKLLKENKKTNKNEVAIQQNLNDKTFIFLTQNINDSLKKKKVMQSIDAMQNISIGLAYDKKQIPNGFQQISTKGDLIQAYRQVYTSLVNICKNFEPSQSQYQYDSQNDDEQISQKSSKKVKIDQYKSQQDLSKKKYIKNKNGTASVAIPKQKILTKQQQSVYKQQRASFNFINNESKKPSAFNNISQQIYNQSQIGGTNQQIPINYMQPNKPIDNMMNNNLMLNNWLSSIKNNNMNLYDNMLGSPLYINRMTNGIPNNINRQTPGYQDQQSMMFLLQQINLYRQLLAQVTYQNQLLGRNIGMPSSSTRLPNMSFMPVDNNQNKYANNDMMRNLAQLNQLQSQLQMQNQINLQTQINGIAGLTNMGGLNGINGISGLNNMSALNGMSGLNGMNGMNGSNGMGGITNMSGMTGIGNMPNMASISIPIQVSRQNLSQQGQANNNMSSSSKQLKEQDQNH